jgi:hypothetical protein
VWRRFSWSDSLGAKLYTLLAVFPVDIAVPDAAVLTLWLEDRRISNPKKLPSTQSERRRS